MEERVRGTTDLPMTSEGRREVREKAELLAKIGKLDTVYHSSLIRAKETAEILAKPSKALVVDLGDLLLPQNLGKLQGRIKSEVIPQLEYYLNQPSKRPPGGESLDDVRNRYLPVFFGLLKGSRYQRSAVVGHGSTQALVHAWIVAGGKQTWDICLEALNFRLPPSTIMYLDPIDMLNELHVQVVSPLSRGPVPFGLFNVRHGMTEWNGETKG